MLLNQLGFECQILKSEVTLEPSFTLILFAVRSGCFVKANSENK